MVRGGGGHLQAETASRTHDSLPEHLSLEWGPVAPCSGTSLRLPLVPALVTLAEKRLRLRSGALAWGFHASGCVFLHWVPDYAQVTKSL